MFTGTLGRSEGRRDGPRMGPRRPERGRGLRNHHSGRLASGHPRHRRRPGGPPEFISQGRDGLLVDPLSVPRITDALRQLLRDPERSARMAAEGRRAVRRFSWERAARSYEEIYEAVLSEAPALARRSRRSRRPKATIDDATARRAAQGSASARGPTIEAGSSTRSERSGGTRRVARAAREPITPDGNSRRYVLPYVLSGRGACSPHSSHATMRDVMIRRACDGSACACPGRHAVDRREAVRR